MSKLLPPKIRHCQFFFQVASEARIFMQMTRFNAWWRDGKHFNFAGFLILPVPDPAEFIIIFVGTK